MNDPRADAADRAAAMVLGACLNSASAIADAAGVLRPDEFRAGADALVYETCLVLWDAGKPADLVSVFDELSRKGRLEDAGGAARLAELAELTFGVAAVTHHAAIVKDHALLRCLAHAGSRIAHLASHPDGPARDVLEEAEKIVFALAERSVSSEAKPLSRVMDEVFDRLDARMEDARLGRSGEGVPTGIAPLDNLTGGLRNGQLCILAARPSVGKTAVGAAVARYASACGHSVLFSSLEQPAHELAERMLCADSGVRLHLVRSGDLPEADADALRASWRSLRPLALALDDLPSQSVLRIAASARRMKHKGGLSLLVVDYLQLIEPEDRRAPRHEQVAATSRRLKALARELEVPVLALAQLNRESEGRSDGRPKLSDLRESGQVEQDADLVVLLHRPRDDETLLEFIVAKQRSGPTGEFVCAFDRARMRISEVNRGPF